MSNTITPNTIMSNTITPTLKEQFKTFIIGIAATSDAQLNVRIPNDKMDEFHELASWAYRYNAGLATNMDIIKKFDFNCGFDESEQDAGDYAARYMENIYDAYTEEYGKFYEMNIKDIYKLFSAVEKVGYDKLEDQVKSFIA